VRKDFVQKYQEKKSANKKLQYSRKHEKTILAWSSKHETCTLVMYPVI
jgi:hypothetical protein